MATLMQTLYTRLPLPRFRFKSLYSKPSRPFLCFFSSLSSLAHTHTTTRSSNPLLFNYLIETFAFSEPQALSISNSLPWIKTLEKPESVVQFLKQLGFSDTDIRSSIRVSPQILSSDIDKTLKPKLQFFQDQGLTGPDLCKFISKHSYILTHVLENKLIPCVDIIKKTLINDTNNQDLIRVLRRCNWVTYKSPELRLLCNIAFLESCGIVGSQLSTLFKRKPRLFVMRDSALRDLISRVLDMGFLIGLRILVRAVDVVSCMSRETFSRKLELFRSFGFSEG